MTIEKAVPWALPKPWGSGDRLPWSNTDPGRVIGEIWFERPGQPDTDNSLLLKLLFTRQPLSIQVHPDDAMAHSLGLKRGKAEAWYILSALPGAKLARGLSQETTPAALRAALADGTIETLVHWQAVQAHDAISIPAGTIHALGAGLVVAELQQRSDTTFRLFDFGRGRELHVESAIEAADRTPTAMAPPRRLSAERVLLVACPQFVFERIDLLAGSRWEMVLTTETWLLVIEGAAAIGPFQTAVGEAVFLEHERALITPGMDGLTALVGTLAAAPADDLLIDLSSSPHIKASA